MVKKLTPNNPKRVIGIKGAITRHIRECMRNDNPRMSLWYCGITNDVRRRNAEHKLKKGKVEFWIDFDAESMNDAHIIERAMAEKMQNLPHKGGANSDSQYVYVFKLISPSYGLGGVVEETNIKSVLKSLGLID